MKTNYDCIPCFIRQALEAVRLATSDEKIHEQVLRGVLAAASKMNMDQSPPVMGQYIHKLIRELSGHDDPYKKIKDRFNNFALKLYPELKQRIQSSSNPMDTAVRMAIAGNPDCGVSRYNLAVGLLGLKKYDEAEKEYREAIRIDPDDTEVRYNLGNLLYDLKRYDETEKEYREVMRMDPDDAEARVNLGILFLEIERPEKAKKEFTIAKELFKNQGNGEDVKKVEELLANI